MSVHKFYTCKIVNYYLYQKLTDSEGINYKTLATMKRGCNRCIILYFDIKLLKTILSKTINAISV